MLSPVGPVGTANAPSCSIHSPSCWPSSFRPSSATLAFAWWFRAIQQARPTICPTGPTRGGLELIVWSIPALVVVLSWAASPGSARTNWTPRARWPRVPSRWRSMSSRSTGNGCSSTPQQGIASVNRLVVPAEVPLHLRITSATVFNVFFVPRLGSEIYAMYGMASHSTCRPTQPGSYPGLSRHFSGDGFSGHDTSSCTPCPRGRVHRLERRDTHARDQSWTIASYRTLLRQSQNVKPYTYSAVAAPGCSMPSCAANCRQAKATAGAVPGLAGRRRNNSVRQADLAGHSFRSADSAGARRRLVVVLLARRAALGGAEGLCPLSVARVDHERRSQAHRHHVLPARTGHAAARLHRRADDALATGPGLSRPGLPAAGALRPDLLRARHDHDFLRGHAVRDRADELRGAAAARRARRGVSHV